MRRETPEAGDAMGESGVIALWESSNLVHRGVSRAVSTPAVDQGCSLRMASPRAQQEHGVLDCFSSSEGDGLGMDGESHWGVF